MAANLEALVARLEVATSRLESLAASGGVGGGAAAGGADAGASSEALEAFDALVNGTLKTFLDLSAKIGGEVKEQAELLQKGFEAQRAFLAVVATSKDPKNQAVLNDLVKPIGTYITAVQEFRDKNRGKRAVADHLTALAEGIPALGWVLAAPKTAPYVQQFKEAAEFYTNRVLKEFKDKDETQKNWAKTFPALLTELHDFVKKYHTTGPAWNPKGGDAASAKPAAAAPAAAAPAATPAATPAPSKPSTPAPTALFSEINKGGEITSGLKKVDRSQMTHKNPELRASGVVQAKEVTSDKLEKSYGKPVATGPPKTELAGNKWTIENHKDNRSIEIAETEIKQVVYIYRCVNSTIVIKGKINQVTLDSCKKVAIVVDSVISGIDVVNSQSCQVQILGKAPTVLVDKTDGMQLFLSKDALDIEILTAKSSEVNVVVPGKTDNDDPTEVSIPEQLKTQWNGTKFVTSILEHKA